MHERYNTFTVLISQINRSIKKIKTEEMSEYNLKSNHVSCLFYIYIMDSLTATKLCDVCREDKASISRSLDFLEKNGYIYSNTASKKKYNSNLILTEKGKTIAKGIAKKIDDILSVASEGISEENRKIMYSSLIQISDNLENICKHYEGE